MASYSDLYKHEFDVADNFSAKAINRMRQDELPPVPQNYEVWYVYYANVNPKLRDDINKLLLDQEKITERDCQDLYEKYLNFGQERETYERAGDQINATLHDVSNLMNNVRETTHSFTCALQNATGKLTDVDVPERIRDV